MLCNRIIKRISFGAAPKSILSSQSAHTVKFAPPCKKFQSHHFSILANESPSTRPATQNNKKSELQSQQKRSKSGKSDGFTNPYQTSLRRFFLKVHPDFFSTHKEFQDVNQKSFQALNALLAWVEKYSAKNLKYGKVENPPFKKYSFSFFHKVAPDQDLSPLNVKQVSADFNVENLEFTDQRSIKKVANAVDSVILSLFEKTGVAKPENFKRFVEDIDEEQSQAEEDVLNTKELREEFLNALNTKVHQRPIDRLKEKPSEPAATTYPTVTELLKAKTIVASPGLTQEQLQLALKTISNNIANLGFSYWANSTLIIDTKYEIDPATGSISIPYNFGVSDFRNFVIKNSSQIDKARQGIRQRAEQIEDLIENITETLKLNKLTVDTSLSGEETLQNLKNLKQIASTALLQKNYPMEGVSLHIGKKFQTSPVDGTITFRSNFSIMDVGDFLRYLTPEKVKNCAELTRVLHDVDKQILELGQKITNDLNIRELDINSAKSMDNVKKLQFLKKLGKLQVRLSRFDWHRYRIVLVDEPQAQPNSGAAPTMDIDTKQGIIWLGLGFSPSELLAKVNKIQQSALNKYSPEVEVEKTAEEIQDEYLKKFKDLTDSRDAIEQYFDQVKYIMDKAKKDPNFVPTAEEQAKMDDFFNQLEHGDLGKAIRESTKSMQKEEMEKRKQRQKRQKAKMDEMNEDENEDQPSDRETKVLEKEEWEDGLDKEKLMDFMRTQPLTPELEERLFPKVKLPFYDDKV